MIIGTIIILDLICSALMRNDAREEFDIVVSTYDFYDRNYDVFFQIPDIIPTTAYYGFESIKTYAIMGYIGGSKFYIKMDNYNSFHIHANSRNYYGNERWVLRVLNEYIATGKISDDVLRTCSW